MGIADDEERQASDDHRRDEIVLRVVGLAHTAPAEEHRYDDSRGLEEGLGGVVEVLHGEVGAALHGHVEDGEEAVVLHRDLPLVQFI
jgi:hypothetical protein